MLSIAGPGRHNN